MDSDYSTYEEKLSAYLDGALPPEEMAEIAARLESDEKMADLLDKMRRLEELAGRALPAFDEAMLDNLEDRIMAGIEGDAEAAEPVGPRTARVIPIWQRYMAVAASIAVIFLVGRMAFKEAGEPLLSPQAPRLMIEKKAVPGSATEPLMEQAREIPPEVSGRSEAGDAVKRESARAAIADESSAPPTPPADDIVIDIPEHDYVPSPPTATNEMGQKQDADEMPMAEPGEAIKKGIAPLPQVETEEMAPPVEAPMISTSPVLAPQTADYMTGSVMPERQRIEGRIIDRETGDPLSGVAVSMAGTSMGAMTDMDGNYVILGVQPGREELVVSAVGYKPVRIDNIAVAPGETEEMTIAMEVVASEIGVAIDVVGPVANEEARSIDHRPDDGAGDTQAEKITIPPVVDELQELLAGAGEMKKSRSRKEYFSAVAPKSAVDGLTEQRLLDSLTALPVSDNRGVLVERLYLKARLGYVLYLRTGQDDYYDRAVSWRDSLISHLEYLDRSLPGNAIFGGYRKDLETWDWRR